MNLRTAVPGFLMAGILVAASPAAGGPRWGVETGVNVSTLDYDEELPIWINGWRPSFTAGGLVEFPFQERVSLVAGVRYLQQGNHVEFDPIVATGEFQIIQSYVSFPLRLELRPLPSQKVFFSVGPELGVLIGGRAPLTLDGLPTSSYPNIRTQLAPTNLLIDVGMGVRLPVENHEATLEVRYAHGVTEAAKDEDWFSNWKTRGIETLVGMRW